MEKKKTSHVKEKAQALKSSKKELTVYHDGSKEKSGNSLAPSEEYMACMKLVKNKIS